MHLKLDQLDAHLNKVAGKLAPLYVLHGDEHLLALEAADRIRSAARAAGYSEREVLHVERHFRWNDLTASAQNMSLFGDRKLVELRIPSGKPGRDGSAALQDYAAGCTASAGDLITLISLPRLDRDGVKSAWFEALARAGVCIEVPLLPRAQLPGWIETRLAAQGQQADRETVAFIAERVEGNLLAAIQEIRKLGLLYPNGMLQAEQVRTAVLNASRYDVFKLREALVEGRLARYARILNGLKGEGEALPLILWSVADGLRRAISTEGTGPRRKKLLSALRKTAEIDKIAKGLRVKNSAGDAWDDLLTLGLMLQTH